MTVLRVGVVIPAPPFTAMPGPSGLDIEMLTALSQALGDELDLTVIEAGVDGSDGAIARLTAGEVDWAVGGIVVTAEREKLAPFGPPYLITGLALAVDAARLPHVRSAGDLAGLTVGVVRGSAAEAAAQHLVADRAAARVRTYDRGALGAALDDLTAGGCDAVLELAPTLTGQVTAVPGVDVVSRGASTERIAVAVAPTDRTAFERLQSAQAELERNGTLQQIRRRWLGNPYLDQSAGML